MLDTKHDTTLKKYEKMKNKKSRGSASQLCDSQISLRVAFCSSVLMSEGKDKIGGNGAYDS